MADYPDYTDLITIIGSDIMIPIDIQAAYIMMPIDIQAQYVTLDIDIVAATVEKVKVDLVAQTIGNIGIDIKANTLGNITIDIETQSVGIYNMPEWAAKENTDKDFHTRQADQTSGNTIYVSYTPPGDKTLYITHFSASQMKTALGESANNEFTEGWIVDITATKYYAALGGNGGFGADFTKPIVIPGNHEVQFSQRNRAGHNADMRVSANGYEV